MLPSNDGRSATPLPKTCQNCADSKVRCVRNGDDICNRCNRLGKECVDRKARRRFHGFQKDMKIRALESKLDELMRTRQNESISHSPSSPGSVGGLSGDDLVDRRDVIDQGFLTMESAEALLSTFKTQMIPHFPFIVIYSHETAEYLRKEKPFLFLAILSAASFADMPLQRLLGNETKRFIASRMVLNGEVSFDLLQGLLVYLAWSHYFTRPYRFTQFMQLAISLIIELRLDKPPQAKSWKNNLQLKPDHGLKSQFASQPAWSLAEQRAIVGCYYIASTFMVLRQRQFNFSLTPYIENCCKTLYNAAESPYDKYIMHMIQLQRIAEKIDRLSMQHAIELGNPGSASELYVSALKADLEAFRAGFPVDLHKTQPLDMQFHATELFLYQLSLSTIDHHFHGQNPSNHTFKEELLFSALIAAESIVNTFNSLPLGAEIALSNTEWTQMGFAILITNKIITTASSLPGKGAAFSQRKFSWSSTLEHLRMRIQALSSGKLDRNGDRDAFYQFSQHISNFIEWFTRQNALADIPFVGQGMDQNSLPVATMATPELFIQTGVDDFFQFPEDEAFNAALDQILGASPSPCQGLLKL
ncbi:Protein SOGA2 [Talaromyces islandicus]|uniref:Protein SOGA2 n=1 Tax=Talaromyces islandicus TaxID=28573 RepID=A0A0U1M6P0_TALIS|nr:Protein SOGA2 [Talaromyces islandicus]